MQCDALLTEGTQEGETRHLEDMPNVANIPRWGTARLGNERKLLLYVRGYDQPLVVSLADEIVLGRYDASTGETPEVDIIAP